MENVYFPYSEKEAKRSGIINRFAVNERAEFPVRLRELRDKKDVTLAIAANGIGVTRSTLGLYEKGENVPDIKVLVRIAHYYGVTVNYLVGEDERPTFEEGFVFNSTGLSADALDVLRNYASSTEKKIDERGYLPGVILSALITSNQFEAFINSQIKYIEFATKQKVLQHLIETDGMTEEVETVLKTLEDVLSCESLIERIELYKIATKHRAMDLYGEFFDYFMKDHVKTRVDTSINQVFEDD